MSLATDRAQRIARQTWVMFLIVESGAVILTTAALIDTLFGLGWGYDWKAVLVGLGICIWGVFVYWICRAVFRFADKVAR